MLSLLRNVSSLVVRSSPLPTPLHLPICLQATGRPGACVVGVVDLRQPASAKRCSRYVSVHLLFRSFGLEWEVVSRIWHETFGFHGPGL